MHGVVAGCWLSEASDAHWFPRGFWMLAADCCASTQKFLHWYHYVASKGPAKASSAAHYCVHIGQLTAFTHIHAGVSFGGIPGLCARCLSSNWFVVKNEDLPFTHTRHFHAPLRDAGFIGFILKHWSTCVFRELISLGKQFLIMVAALCSIVHAQWGALICTLGVTTSPNHMMGSHGEWRGGTPPMVVHPSEVVSWRCVESRGRQRATAL